VEFGLDPGDRVRRAFQDWPQRKYRSWTAKQKLEIVLAGLRGDRSVREVCRGRRRESNLLSPDPHTPGFVRRTLGCLECAVSKG